MPVQHRPTTIDAARSQFLRPGHHFRVLGGPDRHLGDQGGVPVEDEVHLVRLQHRQVDLGGRGFGRPEQDVGDFRGDHGAAPAVRQGAPQGLDQEADRVVVHPHVRAVQHFGDFPVHSPGVDAQFPPFLQPGGGEAPGKGEVALLDAVFLHHGQGQFLGLGQGWEVAGHPELCGQAVQLALIGDAEARRFAFTHGQERLHQVPAVIGVGRGAGGHHAGQVPGHHDVGVGAADAPLGAVPERIDAAGAHDADAAGEPQLAEAALGLLGGKTLPDGFQPFFLGLVFQGQDVGVDGRGR